MIDGGFLPPLLSPMGKIIRGPPQKKKKKKRPLFHPLCSGFFIPGCCRKKAVDKQANRQTGCHLSSAQLRPSEGRKVGNAGPPSPWQPTDKDSRLRWCACVSMYCLSSIFPSYTLYTKWYMIYRYPHTVSFLSKQTHARTHTHTHTNRTLSPLAHAKCDRRTLLLGGEIFGIQSKTFCLAKEKKEKKRKKRRS